MGVQEHRRLRLFERWVDSWGQEEAETMLDLLPPPGHEPATSHDVESLRGDVESLRGDVESLRHQVGRDMAALEVRVDAKLDLLRADLIGVFREEINRAIVTQTRITVFSMVTAFAAVSALVLGVAG